jgi:hypothetical protein
LDTDTPFDQFDSECHQVGDGISTEASKNETDSEDELIFLINMSEHLGRPTDMLMFLGEYFKRNVIETDQVFKAGNQEANSRKLDKFYVTSDIMNFLGTASKLHIENLRQELRISIALWRNPTFNNDEFV